MKTLMNPKKSFLLIIFVAVTILLVATPSSYLGYMFGKSYESQKDFTCCKSGQLYIHHYYDIHIFWVKSISGYDTEAIGKPNTIGCNIDCDY